MVSGNGMGAPGKEVSLSRGSEVLGMTYLGAVTVQAPGLFSDPAEQGWAPNMQSDPVSLTFHTVAKPEIQVALNSLSPSHPRLPQLRALCGSPFVGPQRKSQSGHCGL